jgi:hypothetical protein
MKVDQPAAWWGLGNVLLRAIVGFTLLSNIVNQINFANNNNKSIPPYKKMIYKNIL